MLFVENHNHALPIPRPSPVCCFRHASADVPGRRAWSCTLGPDFKLGRAWTPTPVAPRPLHTTRVAAVTDRGEEGRQVSSAGDGEGGASQGVRVRGSVRSAGCLRRVCGSSSTTMVAAERQRVLFVMCERRPVPGLRRELRFLVHLQVKRQRGPAKSVAQAMGFPEPG